ncbi:MAG TPA: hypothetical protein QF753_17085 [Victivallales bacterium]|nr:hypothetical protein [Victivallales bacterium]
MDNISIKATLLNIGNKEIDLLKKKYNIKDIETALTLLENSINNNETIKSNKEYLLNHLKKCKSSKSIINDSIISDVKINAHKLTEYISKYNNKYIKEKLELSIKLASQFKISNTDSLFYFLVENDDSYIKNDKPSSEKNIFNQLEKINKTIEYMKTSYLEINDDLIEKYIVETNHIVDKVQNSSLKNLIPKYNEMYEELDKKKAGFISKVISENISTYKTSSLNILYILIIGLFLGIFCGIYMQPLILIIANKFSLTFYIFTITTMLFPLISGIFITLLIKAKIFKKKKRI